MILGKKYNPSPATPAQSNSDEWSTTHTPNGSRRLEKKLVTDARYDRDSVAGSASNHEHLLFAGLCMASFFILLYSIGII